MDGFGRYLVQQRELRGLTRQDVVRTTRLSPIAVEALETGDLARIPGRTFVIGYLRTYAACVGLDPDETVLRFEEREQARPHVPRTRRRRRWPLAVAAAAAVAGGLVALALVSG